jgi:hypothetical protein
LAARARCHDGVILGAILPGFDPEHRHNSALTFHSPASFQRLALAAAAAMLVEKTRMGGPPSYIEVQTCLEIARDVCKPPKDDNTGLDAGLKR